MVVLILILGKGSSGRIKDNFICRSYLDSLEEEEQENLRRLCLSFLFKILWKGGSGESKANLLVVLILILGKGRSGRMKDDIGCHVYFDSGEGEEQKIKDDFGCHSYFDTVEGK